ncbi:hypothetical protein [Clostridium septicum]|uniref:Uncharacterized protein n=1 Tax=Clostridium septicum TaxID=1504 RepID=A0A9N7JPN2_CLOSE|nr:hypothetical protein [Clostridium septicum]AYE35781.1 hypothetical protein CP523_15790 [Clostridium septicum]MDU1315090.1 hypothetical protein [Clostridium septicum]QAS61117.1 hypothetical protein EI377_10495 [Clostridium septicum]UEC19545.1 hypothetical protein LK444_08910 [Clostridium septicum]USS02395.1 hypothetical protein NH397_08270 [Clostridium septicum]
MKFDKLNLQSPVEFMLEAEESFKKNYSEFRDMMNGRIHEVFKVAIKDEDFLKIAIFNNDYLNISPVDTFLSYYSKKLPKLSEKKLLFVNALFKNLFKFVLKNENEFKEVNYSIINNTKIAR